MGANQTRGGGAIADRRFGRARRQMPVSTSWRRPASSGQHAARVGGVGGLAEHFAVDHHGGIGAEYDLVRRAGTASAFHSARRRT